MTTTRQALYSHVLIGSSAVQNQADQALQITQPRRITGLIGLQAPREEASAELSRSVSGPVGVGKRHLPYPQPGVQKIAMIRIELPQGDLPKNLTSTLGKSEYGQALMLGSGAPCSGLQIKNILKLAGGRPVHMVNLRAESSVLYTAEGEEKNLAWVSLPSNSLHIDQSQDKTLAAEAEFLKRLQRSDAEKIYSYKDVKKIIKSKEYAEIDLLEHQHMIFHPDELQSEETVALKAGVHHYSRVTVTDHLRFSRENNDVFVKTMQPILLKARQNDVAVWFHCKGGIHRTDVAQRKYDCMHHAKKESFKTIMLRAEKSLGREDLGAENCVHIDRDLPLNDYLDALFAVYGQSSDKEKTQIARMMDLRMFYEFCRESPDDFSMSYSEFRLQPSSLVRKLFDESEGPVELAYQAEVVSPIRLRPI
jgi:hypothetical protein